MIKPMNSKNIRLGRDVPQGRKSSQINRLAAFRGSHDAGRTLGKGGRLKLVHIVAALALASCGGQIGDADGSAGSTGAGGSVGSGGSSGTGGNSGSGGALGAAGASGTGGTSGAGGTTGATHDAGLQDAEMPDCDVRADSGAAVCVRCSDNWYCGGKEYPQCTASTMRGSACTTGDGYCFASCMIDADGGSEGDLFMCASSKHWLLSASLSCIP